MSDRIPLTEKKEYELVIKDKDSRITIRELSVIGNGGSCIVYKGKKAYLRKMIAWKTAPLS